MSATLLSGGAVLWAVIASVMFVVMARNAASVRLRANRLQVAASVAANHWERAYGRCKRTDCHGVQCAHCEMDALVGRLVVAAIEASEEVEP